MTPSFSVLEPIIEHRAKKLADKRAGAVEELIAKHRYPNDEEKKELKLAQAAAEKARKDAATAKRRVPLKVRSSHALRMHSDIETHPILALTNDSLTTH